MPLIIDVEYCPFCEYLVDWGKPHPDPTEKRKIDASKVGLHFIE
jgi:hypothetical protein